MGWTGTNKIYKTNLENVRELVLYGKTENEKQWYRDLCQRGSSVYLLGQNKENGKYWIDCILCQNVRRNGYTEFMYKGIGAIENHCFDVPKKWIDLLDKQDKEVQEYINARYSYEQKKKAEYKVKLGDVFLCTYDYDLSWGGFKISGGEEFYIKYHNWYGHKYFLLCNKDGQIFHSKITRKTFNNLKKTFIKNVA